MPTHLRVIPLRFYVRFGCVILPLGPRVSASRPNVEAAMYTRPASAVPTERVLGVEARSATRPTIPTERGVLQA